MKRAMEDMKERYSGPLSRVEEITEGDRDILEAALLLPEPPKTPTEEETRKSEIRKTLDYEASPTLLAIESAHRAKKVIYSPDAAAAAAAMATDAAPQPKPSEELAPTQPMETEEEDKTETKPQVIEINEDKPKPKTTASTETDRWAHIPKEIKNSVKDYNDVVKPLYLKVRDAERALRKAKTELERGQRDGIDGIINTILRKRLAKRLHKNKDKLIGEERDSYLDQIGVWTGYCIDRGVPLGTEVRVSNGKCNGCVAPVAIGSAVIACHNKGNETHEVFDHYVHMEVDEEEE